MSNYPPGVTGLEYVDECVRVGETVLTRVRGRWSGYPLERGETFRNAHRRVQGMLCTFEGGIVGGTVYDEETFVWACPVCEHENESYVGTWD